jgi:hypothetical protein
MLMCSSRLAAPETEDSIMYTDPLSKSKDEYARIVEHISVPNSPVGIDAQLTHAIIIDYLRQITERLERLEAQLASGK